MKYKLKSNTPTYVINIYDKIKLKNINRILSIHCIRKPQKL